MNATGAVVFLPREGNGPSLMLEELLFDPAALWLAESLRAAGVERFFVVCHTDDQARAAVAAAVNLARGRAYDDGLRELLGNDCTDPEQPFVLRVPVEAVTT